DVAGTPGFVVGCTGGACPVDQTAGRADEGGRAEANAMPRVEVEAGLDLPGALGSELRIGDVRRVLVVALGPGRRAEGTAGRSAESHPIRRLERRGDGWGDEVAEAGMVVHAKTWLDDRVSRIAQHGLGECGRARFLSIAEAGAL